MVHRWGKIFMASLLVGGIVVTFINMVFQTEGIALELIPSMQRFKGGQTFQVESNNFFTYRWLQENCLSNYSGILTMEHFTNMLQKWSNATDSECSSLYKIFTRIFTVKSDRADVILRGNFIAKVKNWLKSDTLMKEVHNQTIISIYNMYTNEQNLANPLREKRPMVKPQKPERQYVEELSAKSAQSCDFCNYKNSTAEDIFGHIESKHSVTVSNTFKVNKWHSMAITRKHHPLNWTEEEFLDLVNTAMKWIAKVHSIDSSYVYPMIVWDLLPHAGASQIHPHIHMFLAKDGYQGGMENWRRAAEHYSSENPGGNYFNDVVMLHELLGLATRLNSAVAFANLVPKKDNEIVVMSSFPNDDFFKLVFITLKEYIDGMDRLCFSLGIALPSLDPSTNNKLVPAFARIVTRGDVEEVRSDISSFDLFTATNVNNDPFKLITKIRRRKARTISL